MLNGDETVLVVFADFQKVFDTEKVPPIQESIDGRRYDETIKNIHTRKRNKSSKSSLWPPEK